MRKLLGAGLLTIFLGIALVFAGVSGQGNVSAGGVIFIGPIPIVFGSGPGGGELGLLSLVIGAVMVLLLFVWSWRLSHPRSGSPDEVVNSEMFEEIPHLTVA